MKYLTNAMSLNMLPATCGLDVMPLSIEAARIELAGEVICAIGHDDTAAVVASELGQPVQAARVTVALVPGDVAVVAQYIGPRLAEGATSLPQGARLEWRKVTVS